MVKYGMVIDLNRCQGCRTCMMACKIENNTPEGNFWMYVFRLENGDYPNTQLQFLPRPCMHCDNAPCVKVCPVGARYKRKDGLTATDADRCIGCRYCEVSCPYGVNYFNWKKPEDNYYLEWDDPALREITGGAVPPYKNNDLDEKYGQEQRTIAGGGHDKGIIEKCTFCVHRLEQGLQPACVAACPVNAFTFGDLDDPLSEVSLRLARAEHFQLLDELGTKPRVYYIGTPPSETKARQIEAVAGRV